MSEHRDWQRQTALAKVDRLRVEAQNSGAPMNDERMARAAAGYVDATAETGAALDEGGGVMSRPKLSIVPCHDTETEAAWQIKRALRFHIGSNPALARNRFYQDAIREIDQRYAELAVAP